VARADGLARDLDLDLDLDLDRDLDFDLDFAPRRTRAASDQRGPTCHPTDEPRAEDDHSSTALWKDAMPAKASERTMAIRPTSGAPDPRTNGITSARSPSRRTIGRSDHAASTTCPPLESRRTS
jgi:hypothetical protein